MKLLKCVLTTTLLCCFMFSTLYAGEERALQNVSVNSGILSNTEIFLSQYYVAPLSLAVNQRYNARVYKSSTNSSHIGSSNLFDAGHSEAQSSQAPTKPLAFSDMSMMLLAGVGLVVLQLRRKQKSLHQRPLVSL